MRIKKSVLWTFILIAAVVVIFIVLSSLKSSPTVGTINQTIFTGNPDLYPSLGPADARNTVIEFSDFQCPYCALASGLPNWTSQYAGTQYGSMINAAGNAEQAAENGQIRFIFVTMNFLDSRTDPTSKESTWAAEAAFCANDQGKFWQMHDAIYAASTGPTEDDGKYTKANLEIIAQSIQGLNQTQFMGCLESDADLLKVQASETTAMSIVQGTPSFFVNGNPVQPSWSAIQAAFK